MAKQLGPVEVFCDSPPYPIVQATALVGFDRPEDVRWFRLSHFLIEFGGWHAGCRDFLWGLLPVNRYLKGVNCTCKGAVPRMRRCLFTTSAGDSFICLLGQCDRCRTMFWEDGGEATAEEIREGV
jgi:hypothetical protein